MRLLRMVLLMLACFFVAGWCRAVGPRAVPGGSRDNDNIGLFVPGPKTRGPAPPSWVAVVVDCEGEGEVKHLRGKKEVDQLKRKLDGEYKEEHAKWERWKKGWLKRHEGMKFEKTEPVKPVIEFLLEDSKDVELASEKAEAAAENCYGVFSVTAGGKTSYEVGHEKSGAWWESIAQSRYAKLYNKWVKDDKEGPAPGEPSSSRAAGGLSKRDARKKARELLAELPKDARQYSY